MRPRIALLALVTLALPACARAQTTASAPPPDDRGSIAMVGPGDRSLATSHFRNRRRDLRFEMLAPSGDSVAMRIALTREERVIPSGTEPEIMLTFAYGAPSNTVDTLVVRKRDLKPEWETLRTSAGVRHIVYDSARVRLNVEPKDSVSQLHTRPTAQHAFAFNEMEMVMRSLPLRDGYQAVLPLFSEIDEQVELDTITVVAGPGAGTGTSSHAWTVRFADPAIVSTYEIDVASRAVLTQTVIQRQSGRRMRYVPDSSSGSPRAIEGRRRADRVSGRGVGRTTITAAASLDPASIAVRVRPPDRRIHLAKLSRFSSVWDTVAVSVIARDTMGRVAARIGSASHTGGTGSSANIRNPSTV